MPAASYTRRQSDARFAPIVHNHDDRYLTAAQVQALVDAGLASVDTSSLMPKAGGTFTGAVAFDGTATAYGTLIAAGQFVTTAGVDFGATTSHRANLQGLNKAESGWLPILFRDTSGTEAKWNAPNMGSATFGGPLYVNDTNPRGGLTASIAGPVNFPSAAGTYNFGGSELLISHDSTRASLSQLAAGKGLSIWTKNSVGGGIKAVDLDGDGNASLAANLAVTGTVTAAGGTFSGVGTATTGTGLVAVQSTDNAAVGYHFKQSNGNVVAAIVATPTQTVTSKGRLDFFVGESNSLKQVVSTYGNAGGSNFDITASAARVRQQWPTFTLSDSTYSNDWIFSGGRAGADRVFSIQKNSTRHLDMIDGRILFGPTLPTDTGETLIVGGDARTNGLLKHKPATSAPTLAAGFSATWIDETTHAINFDWVESDTTLRRKTLTSDV